MRGRRRPGESAAAPAYALPAAITPFSVLDLLRRMHGDARLALSPERRGELAQSIAAIESHYFTRQPDGATAPDLEATARIWLSRAYNSRPPAASPLVNEFMLRRRANLALTTSLRLLLWR